MADDQSEVGQDIKALQSSILVLSQKIKYLVHNEKILGRNILVLNKKIASKSGGSGSGSNISDDQINKILEKQKELETKIKSLESTLQTFSKRYAKEEDLKEMKYIIDNINPLEFTTVEQVKKMIKDNKS
jgi:hypothetical protein